MTLLAAWVLWLGMQGQAGSASGLHDLCMYQDGWKPCGQIKATPRHFQMNGNMVCDDYPDEQRLVCYADPAPAEQTITPVPIARDDHCNIYDLFMTCETPINIPPRGMIFIERPAAWKTLPPAEHVFEIRTKREDHGPAHYSPKENRATNQNCKMGDNLEVIEELDPPDETWHCLGVTRELWLDGKRLGVLKGLE